MEGCDDPSELRRVTMNLSTLLGRKLKDDTILGVLERCGIEKVVYD
ncbi:MAG: hypothetical protein R3A52_24365 [Polyangiales bacterium]